MCKSSLHGALLIDKPQGMTSSAVLRTLKRRYDISKLGHAGTLDPMATGLLVVLIGKATRLQSLFLEAEKAYSGTIQLGLGTDTDDLEGEKISEDAELAFWEGSDEKTLLEQIRQEFSGWQEQVPPQYSALKVKGVTSYRRARRGEQVEHASRRVHVEFIDLAFEGRDVLRYSVRCSKGTYIRSLARDIGRFLDSCASLAGIRRLESSPFSIDAASSLERILETSYEPYLLPIEQLVSKLPRFELSEADCQRLRQGDQIALVTAGKQLGEAELAAVFSANSAFCGLIERTGPRWQIRFLI